MGRTSRHPAKVRQRGAPGPIVRAALVQAGPAHAARHTAVQDRPDSLLCARPKTGSPAVRYRGDPRCGAGLPGRKSRSKTKAYGSM
jgi:hypothetical protein